jgi:hypothetical protein
VTAPLPGGWPLSAAATALLRDPELGGDALLKLALRELVVRGVVHAELGEPRRFRTPRLTLLAGGRPATDLPVPLPLLARELLPHLAPEGSEAVKVVHKAVGARHQLLERLRTDVREVLSTQGLLASERVKLLGVLPRTRWVRTPTGEAWAAVPRGLERAPTAGLSAALPAVGLLLALDQELVRALRSEDDAVHLSVEGDIDGRTLDAVLGDVGTGLDGAVDAGAGGGDGSGDGGGGGD